MPSLMDASVDFGVPQVNTDASTTTLRKERLLKAMRMKARLLKSQLEAAENECKALEAELDCDRQTELALEITSKNAVGLSNVEGFEMTIADEVMSTMTRGSRRETGMTHLPTELLLDIFELCLLDHYHPDIGNFLLVCNRWYNIIVEVPKFWTNIHLTLRDPRTSTSKSSGTSSSTQSRGKPCTNFGLRGIEAYYNACLKRSRGQLLSLSIDASKFELPGGLTRVAQMRTRDGQESELPYHIHLCKILLGNDETVHEQGQLSFLPSSVRWRKLSIQLPPCWERFEIFAPLFTVNTPNLTKFEILEPRTGVFPVQMEQLPRPSGLGIGSGSEQLEEMRYGVVSRLENVVANFEVFTHFFGCQSNPHLQPNLGPSSQYSEIKSLELTYTSRSGHSTSFLDPLYDMTSLVSLTLRFDRTSTLSSGLGSGFGFSPHFGGWGARNGKRLLLPNLRSLSLQGDTRWEILNQFELPSLYGLTVASTGTEALPSLAGLVAQPEELFWIWECLSLKQSMERDFELPPLDPKSAYTLRDYLHRYPSVRKLKIPVKAAVFFADIVRSVNNCVDAEVGVKVTTVSVDVTRSWVCDDDHLVMEVMIKPN